MERGQACGAQLSAPQRRGRVQARPAALQARHGVLTPPTPPPPPLAALCLSPDGRGVKEAHVKLPTELLAAFPPHTGDDGRYLAEISEPRAVDRQ